MFKPVHWGDGIKDEAHQELLVDTPGTPHIPVNNRPDWSVNVGRIDLPRGGSLSSPCPASLGGASPCSLTSEVGIAGPRLSPPLSSLGVARFHVPSTAVDVFCGDFCNRLDLCVGSLGMAVAGGRVPMVLSLLITSCSSPHIAWSHVGLTPVMHQIHSNTCNT